MLNQIVRNWFRPTLGQTSESRRQRLAPRKKNNRRRPSIEYLEARVVPDSNMGTLHLTDPTAHIVEDTHYAAKTDVFAYGNKSLRTATSCKMGFTT